MAILVALLASTEGISFMLIVLYEILSRWRGNITSSTLPLLIPGAIDLSLVNDVRLAMPQEQATTATQTTDSPPPPALEVQPIEPESDRLAQVVIQHWPP
jgi:hypothetical protein